MTIDTLRTFLLWCGLINYGLLALWALLFILARDGLFRLAIYFGFRLSVEQFDAIHYAGITFYKLCILLFFLVPFFVLWLK